MSSTSQATGGERTADAADAGAYASAVSGPASGQNSRSPWNVPPAFAEMPAGLPLGEYTLVGLDLETTGRRLVDEPARMSSTSQATGGERTADAAVAGAYASAVAGPASGQNSRSPWNVPPALAEMPVGLPSGEYTLVDLDLETTGMRLIDEPARMSSTSQATEGERTVDAAVAGAYASAVAGPASGQNSRSPWNVPPALAEMPAGLPLGEYTLVGLDLETTGRSLVDEPASMSSTSQATGGERTADAAVAGAPASAVAGPSDRQNSRSPRSVPPALAEKPVGLPSGEYTLVGLELETTGRRLVDEIIQIAAYSPSGNFAQYIMPYGKLNSGARRRHNVRIVTTGRYRMLQDTTNHKAIKTKTAFAALKDFVNWLESIKAKDQKILLMYHEPRRLYPTLLIQSLIRHRLFERFKTLVAGFTDSYALSAEKCRGTFTSVALRVLTRLLLLDEDINIVDTALDRAAAVYHIINHLANQAGDFLDVGAGGEAAAYTGPDEKMLQLACEFARPVYSGMEAFEALKDLLEKHNNLRSTSDPLLNGPRHERRRLALLRRYLADAGLLYEQLQDAWQKGGRTGVALVIINLKMLSLQDMREFVDLFHKHFNPEADLRNFRYAYNSDEAYESSDSDSPPLSMTDMYLYVRY